MSPRLPQAAQFRRWGSSHPGAERASQILRVLLHNGSVPPSIAQRKAFSRVVWHVCPCMQTGHPSGANPVCSRPCPFTVYTIYEVRMFKDEGYSYTVINNSTLNVSQTKLETNFLITHIAYANTDASTRLSGIDTHAGGWGSGGGAHHHHPLSTARLFMHSSGAVAVRGGVLLGRGWGRPPATASRRHCP